MIFDPSNPPATLQGLAPPTAPPASIGIAGEIRQLVRAAVAWEQANPRKTAMALLWLSVHSSRLKPVAAFVAALLGLQLGCASVGMLNPKSQAALTHIECVAKALKPVLLADAEQVAKALEDGQITLPEVLAEVKASEELVKAIRADTEACK